MHLHFFLMKYGINGVKCSFTKDFFLIRMGEGTYPSGTPAAQSAGMLRQIAEENLTKQIWPHKFIPPPHSQQEISAAACLTQMYPPH